MNKFFYRIPALLRSHRLMAYVLFIALVVIFFMGLGKLWRDDSIESWLGESSPVIKQQRHLEKIFGNNEDLFIIVGAKDGDMFSSDSIAALHQLHTKLETFKSSIQQEAGTPLEHIKEIVSLVDVQINEVDQDSLFTKPFIGSRLPSSNDELTQLKHKALNDIDLLKRFISSNGQYATIAIKTNFAQLPQSYSDVDTNTLNFDNVETMDMFSEFKMEIASVEDAEKTMHGSGKAPRTEYQEYADFVTAVRAIVKSANITDTLDVHYAGLPELIAFHVFIEDENGLIFMGLFLLMALVLGGIFKHLSVVIWCMLIPIFTVIFTLGCQGWVGLPTSDLTAAMVLLLIIISVADAVHIVSGYKYHRNHGFDHTQSIAESMSKSGVSCLLTTLTTMAAFLSLYIVKPNMPTAIFGLFTTIGLVFAFLLSIVLVPLLLDVWRPKFEAKKDASEEDSDIHDSFLEPLSSFVCKKPKSTLFLCLVVLMPIILGVVKLEVDSNPLESFDESTYLRQAFNIADKHLGGTQNIEFVIDTGSIDGIYDARVLKTIEVLQEKMKQEFPQLISTSISVVNVLKRINQQFHNNDPVYYALPTNNNEISQLLFLFNNASPEERRKLVSEDFDVAKVSFSLVNSGSTEYVDLVKKSNIWSEELFSSLREEYPNLQVSTAGGVVIFMTLFDKIASSQVVSFLLTLICVSVAFFCVFKSFRFGLLAIVPNLTPVLVMFGVMGWMGISLNNVTMILAPVILGVAVDDTIHFVHKLQLLTARGEKIEDAIKKAFSEVGRALTYTTLILTVGLLTLLYSSNTDFQAFGYLSAIAFMTALIAEFTITPALLILFGKSKRYLILNQSQILPKKGTSYESTI